MGRCPRTVFPIEAGSQYSQGSWETDCIYVAILKTETAGRTTIINERRAAGQLVSYIAQSSLNSFISNI